MFGLVSDAMISFDTAPARLSFQTLARRWLASQRSGWVEYSLAAAATYFVFKFQQFLGLTAVLQIQVLHLHTHIQLRGFLLLLVVVILSAYLGGAGPGMLSTFLAAGLMGRLLMAPANKWDLMGGGNGWQWATFIVSGVLCGALIERHHHRDRQRLVRQRMRDATLANIGDAVITADELGNTTFLNYE